MTRDYIRYRKGYKYQLAEDYSVQVGILPLNDIATDWLRLTSRGWLYVKKGYAWDGPSGPTWDTNSAMRGSLVHDALYQLMRLGLLDECHRGQADAMLRDICIDDGMYRWRADVWKEAVNLFAESAARAGSEPEILTAP